MLERAERVHNTLTSSEIAFFPALVCFTSSGPFDLSLEDLIQGPLDTAWPLVEA